MAFVNRDNQLERVNHALCKMLGYTERELAGKTIDFVTHPDDLQRTLEMARQVFKNETPRHAFEKRYFTKDGRVVWGRLSAAVIHGDDNQPLYGLGLVEDITRRKQAESELRTSEARFRRLYESNIIGVGFSDLDGTISNANDAFLQMIGYGPQDLPICATDLTPNEFRDLDDRAIESLRTIGSVTPYEKMYTCKDGLATASAGGRHVAARQRHQVHLVCH